MNLEILGGRKVDKHGFKTDFQKKRWGPDTDETGKRTNIIS